MNHFLHLFQLYQAPNEWTAMYASTGSLFCNLGSKIKNNTTLFHFQYIHFPIHT